MKKTKLTLLLLAAVLIGVCIGFYANTVVIRARIQRYAQLPANMPEHITNRLTQRLQLDDEQRLNVLAVFQKHETRMKETREQSRALLDAMIEEVRLEVAQHLTPEQQEEHKRILEELKERRETSRALMRAFPSVTTNSSARP
jgi:hypothetical protein